MFNGCIFESSKNNKHFKFYIMKTQINIWNPTTGNEVVTLDELRSRIADRRHAALNPIGKSMKNSGVTVRTTDKSLKQAAAHYRSFEINQFGHAKAIEVFNAGGCQVATLAK